MTGELALIAPIEEKQRHMSDIPNPDLRSFDLTTAIWRKASASGGEGNCVEVAQLPGGDRAVRDSKDPCRGFLRFTAAEWAAFRAGALGGHADYD